MRISDWSSDVRSSDLSAESLQRDDEAYDIIIVLGHNDDPPVPGAGSAIFFHIWVDGRPTEGCVAIAPKEMRRILERKSVVEGKSVSDHVDIGGRIILQKKKKTINRKKK